MSFTETIAASRLRGPPIPDQCEPRAVATGAANLGGALLAPCRMAAALADRGGIPRVGGRRRLAGDGCRAGHDAVSAPFWACCQRHAGAVVIVLVGLDSTDEFLAIRSAHDGACWAIIAALGVLLGTLQELSGDTASLIGLASQTAHPRVSIIGRKRMTCRRCRRNIPTTRPSRAC
jgi:hypothetical protein